MTTNMASLIEDAKRAGYTVADKGAAGIWITTRGVGLIIYPDGTAFDASVRLDVAKGIRAYKDMRRILGIER
jgi:hypothetical protein